MAIYFLSFAQALAVFVLSSATVLVSGQTCTGPTACEDDGSCGSCKTARNDEAGCSCSGCECVVCKDDPFCCAKEWDHICVKMAEELCECVVFPTASPSASPTITPLPTYQTYPPNLFFSISGLYYTSFTNLTGIYAANTDGLGGPPSRLHKSSGSSQSYPTGSDAPITAIAATSCNLRRLYYTSDSDIKYASIDGSEPPTTVYSYLNYVDSVSSGMTSLYDLGAIAVDEDNGKIVVGSRSGGLFMMNLDGTSGTAETLEPQTESILAVTQDPVSGNLYYFGRSNINYAPTTNTDSFVKVIRPPFDKSPRALYTIASTVPADEYYYQNTGDMTIGGSFIYFVANQKVYKALKDGTGTNPEILFSTLPFNSSSAIRTLDFYNGHLYMGVFSSLTGNSAIWEAKADGSGTPSKLYDFPGSAADIYKEVGITGCVVLTCESPTESPTPCSSKEQTYQVYPPSNATLAANAMTVPFVFKVEWEVTEMWGIYVVIEKRSGGVWNPYEPGLVVDLDSGIQGTYVHMHTLEQAGTYRWLVHVNITKTPCQVEDNTGWWVFRV